MWAGRAGLLFADLSWIVLRTRFGLVADLSWLVLRAVRFAVFGVGLFAVEGFSFGWC
jgi:hypothetical protein